MNKDLEEVIKDANKSTRKGDYAEYEYYKARVSAFATSSEEYEESVRKIAKSLRV